MSDLAQPGPFGRSSRLDQVLTALLSTAPELEAAAVVSFDGLPMASALPAGMDEDRVAAMSAALLSLGDRAAQGLGRGDLSQVYVEGETGTVFLVSADDEAVLVAVANKRAKIGMMLFEVRRAAEAVAAALLADDLDAGIDPYAPLVAHQQEPEPAAAAAAAPAVQSAAPVAAVPEPAAAPVEPARPAYDQTGYDQTGYEQPGYTQTAQSDQTAHTEPAAPSGPVMVPTGPSAPSGLAPDGLSWPQLPTSTEPGWS